MITNIPTGEVNLDRIWLMDILQRLGLGFVYVAEHYYTSRLKSSRH